MEQNKSKPDENNADASYGPIRSLLDSAATAFKWMGAGAIAGLAVVSVKNMVEQNAMPAIKSMLKGEGVPAPERLNEIAARHTNQSQQFLPDEFSRFFDLVRDISGITERPSKTNTTRDESTSRQTESDVKTTGKRKTPIESSTSEENMAKKIRTKPSIAKARRYSLRPVKRSVCGNMVGKQIRKYFTGPYRFVYLLYVERMYIEKI